jgi:predicted AAA+ superfamily ATPase
VHKIAILWLKIATIFSHLGQKGTKMRRLIDLHLETWAKNPYRKSLLLHGARQVGKTYTVRRLGKSFDNFIEVNFESNQKLASIFEQDLNPKRILRDLCTAIDAKLPTIGKTLLFLDEIQSVPQAIITLRYFYEEMPELHVIAAGSLLEFAIQQVGMPVGRVQSLYMYPMTFIEYLVALGHTGVVEAILGHDFNQEISSVIHDKLIILLAQYSAIGGMPQAVDMWRKTQDLQQCVAVHQSLISSYRQDFYKYARQKQIDHVSAIFENIPLQLGRKFKYSEVEGDYRSRELSPGLDLLCSARVAHKVWYTAGQGIPLGAQKLLDDFKVILLDVGLSQAILGLQPGSWLLQPETAFINKGEHVEALVGQELMGYIDPIFNAELYYWHRRKVGGEAELDYLIQKDGNVIPIEVKSGKGTTLKSMHVFLEHHPKSPYGLRFSTQNYSVYQNIRSLPLYAVASIFVDKQQFAFESLVR